MLMLLENITLQLSIWAAKLTSSPSGSPERVTGMLDQAQGEWATLMGYNTGPGPATKFYSL